jgi:membrane fusion protein, multidrug efflux system
MKNTTNITVLWSKYAIKYVVIGLSIAAALAACSKPDSKPEAIRAVKVLTVGESGVVARHEYSGEVRARVESRLGFRVGGKITKRQAEVGQRVKAGQVLAQIDPQDFKLAADAARAQVAAAATNRDLAAADFKRFQVLKDQNFISGAELERRETVLKAAQAQLEQAQAQLAAQGNQANYTNLLADAAGVVVAVEAEAGQVVAAGTPVVRVAVDGVRDVVFSVPEDRIGSVKLGQAVAIKLWAQEGSATGRVREVAAVADPVTRTFPVKVALDAGGQSLALGSTVYVYPSSEFAGVQVIKLPTSALRQEGGSSAVWLYDKATSTVKSAPVVVATADGNEAVIASGIKNGDIVVSAGVHVLSPNQKVTLFNDNMANVSAKQSSAATAPVATAPAK